MKTATSTTRKSQFDGIENYKVNQKKVYLNQVPGIHTLEILSVKSDQAEKTGVYFFSADLKIVQTNNPNYKSGDVLTFYVDASKFGGELFFRDSKLFAAVALKVDPEDIEATDLMSLVSEDQPVTGEKIKAVVAPKKHGAKSKTGEPGEIVKTAAGEVIHRVDLFPVND